MALRLPTVVNRLRCPGGQLFLWGKAQGGISWCRLPNEIKREFSNWPVGKGKVVAQKGKAVTLRHVKPLLPTGSGMTGWGVSDWGRQLGADL